MDARTDMTRKLSRDEATTLYDSGWWKEMDPAEAARLQLRQERLCMPFDKFQLAVDKLLGRLTWTHEYAHPERLIVEAGLSEEE